MQERELIELNEVDFNEDASIVYVDPLNQRMLSLGLITFSMELFANAERIKRLDEYSSLNVPPSPDLITKIRPFIFENMTDIWKIVTAFENFMKAKLLLSGYVVHEIRNQHEDASLAEKYKHLRNKQKKMPIKIGEVRMIEEFVPRPGEKVRAVLPGILNKTISIGTMFSSRYQRAIQLPSGVLRTVIDMNAYRNTHHFLVMERFGISTSVINSLNELNLFVMKDMRALYDELEAEKNQNNSSKK